MQENGPRFVIVTEKSSILKEPESIIIDEKMQAESRRLLAKQLGIDTSPIPIPGKPVSLSKFDSVPEFKEDHLQIKDSEKGVSPLNRGELNLNGSSIVIIEDESIVRELDQHDR